MRAVFAVAAIAALVLAGCGRDAANEAVSSVRSTTETSDEARVDGCSPRRTVGVRHDRFAYAGETMGTVTAYRTPAGRRLHTFPRRTSLGATVVLGIRGVVYETDCDPSWYRVQLPIRPHGQEGYVRAQDLRVYRV
ncbi:MAG: hypothetical protein KY396_04495, partial [Actinobacteria bacterium]|nr:hypothetical protein [Actinomycetota bacterium]